jgi:hypothetical protein
VGYGAAAFVSAARREGWDTCLRNALYGWRAGAHCSGMSDQPDPPRKFYDLKAREFERVNAPPTPPPTDETPVAAPGATPPADSGPISVQEMFRQAQLGGPLLSSQAKREKEAAANEVHAILRDNQARDEAAGLFAVSTEPKRPSKRKRDYWIWAILATVVLLPIVLYTGFYVVAGNRAAAIPFVCSLSALVMVHLMLYWIMWHIFEDYHD